MSIERINVGLQVDELVQLIREAYLTVAMEFGLNQNNAPTNAAFIAAEDILKAISAKEITFFGFFQEGNLIGCYALEKAADKTYYLERLAVKPAERHRGIGSLLVFDAFAKASKAGGKRISIGIIDKNETLKQWYKNLGFRETGKKDFARLPFRVCFLEYVL